MISGIDVSNNQGAIIWPKVAASGIQFAIIKASEGTTFADTYMVANLRDAAANGIAVGTFHFALQGRNSPEQEAQHYLDVVGPYMRTGYVPVLDMEDDPYGGTIPDDCGPWAETWLAIVGKGLRSIPMLYTNLNLIRNHGLNTPTLAQSGLWLSSPGTAMPAVPAPWPVLAIWQRSWTGSVPGISGGCDLDTFMGDVATFRRYGVPEAAPPPADPCEQQLSDVTAQRDAAYKRITDAESLLTGSVLPTLQGVSS